MNAEDAFNNFRPVPGRIAQYLPPGGVNVRMDSHLYPGALRCPVHPCSFSEVCAICVTMFAPLIYCMSWILHMRGSNMVPVRVVPVAGVNVRMDRHLHPGAMRNVPCAPALRFAQSAIIALCMQVRA